MEGRIIKVLGGIYTVVDLDTKETYEAKARGKFRSITIDENSSFNKRISYKNKIETRTIKLSPKVGDYVTFELLDGSYMITDLKPRFNDLERPLAANVDQVVLIFAAKDPLFQDYLLDQFLVLMEERNVKVKIIITKIDLCTKEELDELKEKLSYYQKHGYETFFVNSKEKFSDKFFEELFKNKISVLSGQTGAGKSSFLNALIPGFSLKTQETSKALGRGKHTTRASEFYPFAGGYIADTPGFSKLDFSLLDEKDLKNYFIDFDGCTCKFQDCLHINEPGCGVKEAVNKGQIIKSRYDNYVKFFNELKNVIRHY